MTYQHSFTLCASAPLRELKSFLPKSAIAYGAGEANRPLLSSQRDIIPPAKKIELIN